MSFNIFTWILIITTTILVCMCVLLIIYFHSHYYKIIQFKKRKGFQALALELGYLTREFEPDLSHIDLSKLYPRPWQIKPYQLHLSQNNTSNIPHKIWRSAFSENQYLPPSSVPSQLQLSQTIMTPSEQLNYIKSLKHSKLSKLAASIAHQDVLSQLWKYLIAYDYGGIIVDSNCIVKDLSNIDMTVNTLYVSHSNLQKATKLFKDGALRSDIFITSPRHPTFLNVINQVCANLEALYLHEDHRFMRVLGKEPYSQANKISCTTGCIPFSYFLLQSPLNTTILSQNLNNNIILYKQQKFNPKMALSKMILKHKKQNVVPAILHLSWTNKKKVPQRIWNHLKTVVPSYYDVRFYSDNDCRLFIEEEYGKDVLHVYDKIKKGAHRADTFRYAVLYKYGGVWLDIKTKPLIQLDEMFDRTVPFTTGLTSSRLYSVYQGIIAAAPRLAFLADCFVESLKYGDFPSKSFHTYMTNLLYMKGALIRNTNKQLHYGLNQGLRFDFKLIEERVLPNGNDRYGVDSQLYDENGFHLAKTRYDDFPYGWE